MDNQWFFLGSSGKRYTFDVAGKTAPLPCTGGIFIPVYAHPRGHLAGFAVHPLLIEETDDLQSAVSAVQHNDCLLQACWNYTLILPLDDPGQRIQTFQDLALIDVPCQ
nr:hypothetical protein [uncultured Desulfobulbus sp.]